ncbi:hypothetical protein CcaverHIS002_0302590 [Cutaneotrichosporon cavernicola]|nr:hypothetical protein CcaverHIS002_0302590 [Cutaneotrichosporon cavernicola]BEI97967.1 hypothetical protein CcaverHIS631_0302660 [Cutaneotrichosporon cavernicola]BEJ05743.1 hypothetical protein CcaverHIS641_0302650 [Cutaneotrichosporon cavernicola]
MPRRGVPPVVAAPLAPAPPSPIVQRLRQDWRWAGISQFVWTFSDGFGLIDWDIEALEHDLDGTEDAVIPDLIAKMLYALTWNRQINRDNAFEHLHKQWLKREPETNPFGALEEPNLWGTLGLSQKVEALWRLCEWQLADPTRLRSLLKTEDDPASWRVDPVGWDKAGNTYFLFDDNRLWVQRTRPLPPRAPKATSLKAKRAQRSVKRSKPAPKKSHKKKTPAKKATPERELCLEPVEGPRKRTQVTFYGNVTPTVDALKRGGPPAAHPRSDRATRSSARNAPATSPVATPSRLSSQAPPLPRGTRVSRRLRNVDDEWQQIPDEWLQTAETKRMQVTTKNAEEKTDSQADDDGSELSELTDEEEHQAELNATRPAQDMQVAREDSPLSDAPEEPSPPPEIVDDDGDEDYKPEADEIGEGADEEREESERNDDSASPKVETDDVQHTKGEAGDEIGRVEEDEKLLANAKSLEPMEELDANQEINSVAVYDSKRDVGEPEAVGAKMDIDIVEANETIEAYEGEEEEHEEGPMEEDAVKKEDDAVKEEDSVETDEVKLAVKEAAEVPDGFIEWEAVCVTLYDWKTWPEQFAKSRDPDEKALYKLLANDVAPQIIEVLTVSMLGLSVTDNLIKEQERLKQEAINNRKRSSRIATRELAREEELRRDQAQREMEERMERVRQEQAAKEKAEAEHLAREQRREARLREREERLANRDAAIHARVEAETLERERAERRRERRKRRRDGEEVESSSDDGTASRPATRAQTPSRSAASSVKDGSNGQSWEMKCEVCKLHGWNLADDADAVCCDDCGRWQHVKCHDRQDIAAGRGIRDWDQVDFRCSECDARSKRPRVSDVRQDGANGTICQQTATQNGSQRRSSASQYPVPYPSNPLPAPHSYHSSQPPPHRQAQYLPSHPPQAANGHQQHPTYLPQSHQPHQLQHPQGAHTSPQASYQPMPQVAQPYAQHTGMQHPGHPLQHHHVHPQQHPGYSIPENLDHQAPQYRPEHVQYPHDVRYPNPRADYTTPQYSQPPQRPEYAPRHDYHGTNGGHAAPQPYSYPHTSPPTPQYSGQAAQQMPPVKYTGEMDKRH